MNDDRSDSDSREGDIDQPRERRSNNADDILGREIVANAGRSSAKLRELLAGTILVQLTDSGKRFLIDWSQPELKSTSVGKEASADCTISLSEDHLKRIASGELNPQIAMLSEKVQVAGRKGAAMYLFNLIAPRNNL